MGKRIVKATSNKKGTTKIYQSIYNNKTPKIIAYWFEQHMSIYIMYRHSDFQQVKPNNVMASSF